MAFKLSHYPDSYFRWTPKTPASKGQHAGRLREVYPKTDWTFCSNSFSARRTSQSSQIPSAWVHWTFLWVPFSLLPQFFMKLHPLDSLVQTWHFLSASSPAQYWLFIGINCHSLIHLVWLSVWLWLMSIVISHSYGYSSSQFKVSVQRDLLGAVSTSAAED